MIPTSNRQPPASKPRGRGGRRPGAGARPDNLNALKHGLRSRQFAELGMLLPTIPETRQALLGLARRHQLKQRRAEEVAATLFTRLLQHAAAIAQGRSNVNPPIDEGQSIKPNPRPSDTPRRQNSPNSRPTIKPPT